MKVSPELFSLYLDSRYSLLNASFFLVAVLERLPFLKMLSMDSGFYSVLLKLVQYQCIKKTVTKSRC